MADIDQVAVLELHAADVFVRLADERYDDADIADRNLHHGNLFDLRKPGVQIPRAGQQDLLLQTAPTAAIEKRLRVLEVVVARNDRAGDLASLDWPAVKSRHDADHV